MFILIIDAERSVHFCIMKYTYIVVYLLLSIIKKFYLNNISEPVTNIKYFFTTGSLLPTYCP